MLKCVVFTQNFTNRHNKYKFVKNVKYIVVDETITHYITCRGTKLPKRAECKLYNVVFV